jgi:hypothetical protein
MIAAMPRFALPPVLHTLLQLMRGDDLSLRVAATACVCVFVRALARSDGDDRRGASSLSPGEFRAVATSGSPRAPTRCTASFLAPCSTHSRTSRWLCAAGFHRVLGALVEHWPNEYGDMSALCAPVSATSDANFFEAIAGVQSSADCWRSRALANDAKQWLPERITSLFVPLLHRMILDADAKRNDVCLARSCCARWRALAARLDWPLYLSVLRRMLDAAATDRRTRAC